MNMLSGGERSLTTVAFLIALWDRMRSPVRCLDEFEVFMDGDKKSRATKMICQFASRHEKTQVCFIGGLVQIIPFFKVILLSPTGLCEEKEDLEESYGDIFKYVSLKKPIRG